MALEKATIDILSGARAGEQVRVLFNPGEYTIERSNAYKSSAVPGLSGPLIQFVNGEADTLAMELFLDDYTDKPRAGEKGVRERLDELAELLEIDRDAHAPPIVRFVWGKLSFKAIIEKLSRKLSLFQPEGVPARATASVTFKEYKTLPEYVTQPRLQSADKTKRRLIVAGDNLWLMAGREYDDPRLWRAIAAQNDFDDPRDAAPGDWVSLPPLETDNGSRSRL